MTIYTRLQWIAELEKLSPQIATLKLSTTGGDFAYAEKQAGGHFVSYDKDPFILANSQPHNQIIVAAASALHGRTPTSAIRNLLGELLLRKTYGAFSELVAYKWLGDAGVNFTGQVKMSNVDVVNPNGSTIDGQITLASGKIVCFDVKGFGFIEHKLSILKEKLEAKFPTEAILIEGGFYVSIDVLQNLLSVDFLPLVTDLQTSRVAKRGVLEFRRQPKQRVTISSSIQDPLKLAQENREYPLRFAGQYARTLPFILIFVIHPWFSMGSLHQNFGGHVDTFTKELSSLAFTSFANDTTLVEGLPRADATKLLSGLAFVDGWPATGTDAPRPSPFCRIFLNSKATHTLTASDLATFQGAFGADIAITII